MCLYGNVQRVKFFDKPSYSCLVEYESPEQVEDAISFMKGEFWSRIYVDNFQFLCFFINFEESIFSVQKFQSNRQELISTVEEIFSFGMVP